MPACCAFGCINRSSGRSIKQQEKEKEKTITFHKFPKNLERRAAWIKAIRRVGWEPNQNSVVCSEHFTENSFDRTSLSCVRLGETAVPSVFPSYPSYLQKKQKPPRRKLVRVSNIPGITPILPANVAQSPCTSDGVPALDIPCMSTSAAPEQGITNIRKFESRTTSFSPLRRIHRELSPEKISLVRKLREMKDRYQKKIKMLQQSKRRDVKKIATLSNVLKGLKEQKLLLAEQLQTLHNIGSPNTDILRRQMAKTSQGKVCRSYSPELRKFAVTLHYYSPSAYKYVRNSFNSCLPHPKTISKWYSTVNGEPGFTAEAFTAIKLKSEYSDKPLVASLCIDEMSIRRRIEFDGKKYYGYVNFGVDHDDDSSCEAKDAFVFLVVCINDSWKIPVAYFLVDGVNSDQRCNLVNICLGKCHEAGLKIVSVTFDGAASNMTMMDKLGCNINKQISWFYHPETREKVCLYLDPCHMLKNVRNAFGDKKIFFDNKDRIINWNFIVFLQQLQENEGLNLANRIKKVHVDYKKQIMKVRLAAQLLSCSTATALEFCCDHLKLPEFQNCAGTVDFIRYINNLFDILNSKNMWQFGLKQALCENNSLVVLDTLNVIDSYIRNLKCKDGTKIIFSNRRVGFIGFLTCICSIRSLYTDLIVERSLLKYIPTFKLNQDHLEMLFSSIRAQGGFNNNPTSRQFSSAYKKLLIHSELKPNTSGNCVPLGEISFLHVSSTLKETNAVNIINRSTNKFRVLDEHITVVNDVDHHYEYNSQELTIYSAHIVGYISGFIVRHLKKQLFCEQCLDALEQYADKSKTDLQFMVAKDVGGLIYPSNDVINICKTSEKIIRQALYESGGHHLKKKYNTLYLVSSVLKYYVEHKVFEQLNYHCYNQNPTENHAINLIRAIAEKYVVLRLHYIVKNIPDTSKTRRQQLNKLVLFQGW